MVRRPRFILAATIACSVAILQVSAVSAKDYCADSKSEAASLWGGDRSDWKLKPNTDKTGWEFQSTDDERIRAPRVGTLTFDRVDGKRQYIWSSPGNTRFIWIDHGTVWCRDKRGADNNRPLSKVVRSASVAASKYRAGSAANWTRVGHSQSRGWHFVASERTRIYVFHGKVDHEFGTTRAGNWTPAVTVATAWF